MCVLLFTNQVNAHLSLFNEMCNTESVVEVKYNFQIVTTYYINHFVQVVTVGLQLVQWVLVVDRGSNLLVEAIKQLEELGVQTILTSGGETAATEGIKNLAAWQQKTSMTLMPGGGVSPQNASNFKDIGLKAIHCSGTSFGKELKLSGKISMNSSKHLVEHQVAVSNVDTLKAIVRAVK